MSPPLPGVEGEGQTDVQSVVESGLKERNYFGLSDCSSVDSSTVTSFSEDNKGQLNLKATELTLGLPGSQSPERDQEVHLLSSREYDEKPLFPLVPLKDGICSVSQKTPVSGNKRGFSDTTEEIVEKFYTEANWMLKASGSDSSAPQSCGQGKFLKNGGVNLMLSRPTPNSGVKSYALKEQPGSQQKALLQELPLATSGVGPSKMSDSNNNNGAPAAKAQVVGWPPIRSFRKNSLATTSKNNDEVDGKPGAAPLFVKVSMDGAPYLRKVDLRLYFAYQELSSALEKMFSCFTLGECGSNVASGMENMSETKVKDLLHGSEYVLTYEDKDGDWMLVGDVPWEMFIETCKRLKIMKSSDAIGLAPRATEKSKNRS